MNNKINSNHIHYLIGLLALLIALVGGLLSIICYLKPDFLLRFGGLKTLRPIHVSAALFWILSIAQGFILQNLEPNNKPSLPKWMPILQIVFWIIAFVGIIFSYVFNKFGGREYWEFPPVFALPLLLSWIFFLTRVIIALRAVKQWKIYHWMWLSGASFFTYLFLEGYLWLIPHFRNNYLNDIAIQWKSNGALVGAWNQLIYGSAFYVMDQINRKNGLPPTRIPFWIFLLGFSNLCFNWGHHFYLLPGTNGIRWLSYLVSMTEWILFLRIVYQWRQNFMPTLGLQNVPCYPFLIAAEYWVALNLLQALLMSIPTLNVYTHGTHITVAHAMGTTIGINSMLLFAMLFFVLEEKKNTPSFLFKSAFFLVQTGLFIIWLGLILAGVKKGLWQVADKPDTFGKMMESLKPYFISSLIGGILLAIGLSYLVIYLIKRIISKK